MFIIVKVDVDVGEIEVDSDLPKSIQLDIFRALVSSLESELVNDIENNTEE